MKILQRDVLGYDWNEGIKINRPRKDYQLPIILTKPQISAMISVTPNIKHKSIMAVLYSGGLRIDELINLKMEDIDSERMMIRIDRGKGNKSRDTLLAVKTLELLRAYYRDHYPKPTHYVFESWKPGQRYSSSSVQNIVKRAAAKAGIKKKVFPHSFRHAFATHMLEDGANLKLIQKLLGHRSLGSTMVYLHLAAIDSSVKSPFDLC